MGKKTTIKKWLIRLALGPYGVKRSDIREIVAFTMKHSLSVIVKDEVDKITDEFMRKLGYE